MKLRKICEEIEYTLLQGSLETEVRDIIYDSRKIAPETMFVCMVGAVVINISRMRSKKELP